MDQVLEGQVLELGVPLTEVVEEGDELQVLCLWLAKVAPRFETETQVRVLVRQGAT